MIDEENLQYGTVLSKGHRYAKRKNVSTKQKVAGISNKIIIKKKFLLILRAISYEQLISHKLSCVFLVQLILFVCF